MIMKIRPNRRLQHDREGYLVWADQKSFAIMELACPGEPEEVQDQVDLASQHGRARMRDAAPGGRLG
jgi:hypothetical protein